ncbi:MAG: hypothetical protein R2739_05405 [Chitinophagales bacterium]|nr:hypothetical protein [Bacteroidota bacterium]
MKHSFLLLFLLISNFTFSEDTLRFISDTTSTVLENIKENSTDEISVNAVPPTPTKRKWKADKVHLLIGINYSYYNPIVSENDIFQGSKYSDADSSMVWEDRHTKINLAKQHRISNFQINLQANFWKGLYFGMNYQITSIKRYKKDEHLGNFLSKKNSTFLIVSAQVGYVFEFLKNKALQIHPSIRIGGYAADDYYDSGIGKKFYFGTDVQLRYLIKRKAGFSLGFDYDFLRYKKKGYDNVFQQETFQKTTFNNFHLNAGLYFNITIDTKK